MKDRLRLCVHSLYAPRLSGGAADTPLVDRDVGPIDDVKLLYVE